MTNKRNRPFFSVIIPAHNSAEFIRKGLNSIMKQTFTDYELIIVCDKCEDHTADVALGYADKVLIRNYGLDGLARNAGIDAAEGQYLLFMDDDDWWIDEDAFRKIADKIREEPVDVVLLSFEWDGRGYRNQRGGRVFAVWAKAWKREFIGDTRFSAKPYWSDVGFDREMFKKPHIEGYIDDPLYFYNYMRPGSISWRQKVGEIE